MRALCLLCAVVGCGRLGFDERRGSLEIVVASHAFEPTPRVPVRDAVVWSTTATGAIDDIQRTDVNGRATVRIERGGTVSVYDVAAHWVSTFTGAAPDDRLIAELPVSFEGCPEPLMPRGKVAIDWVAPVPAPEFIEVTKGCSSASVGPGVTNVDLDLYGDVSEPVDLVLRAYDVNSDLIASATKRAVSFHDGIAHSFSQNEWRPGVPTSFGFGSLGRQPPGTTGFMRATLGTANAMSRDAGAIETLPQPILGDALGASKLFPADATRMTLLGFVQEPSTPGVETMKLFARTDVPIGVVAAGAAPPMPMSPSWRAELRQMSWTFATQGTSDAVDLLLAFGDTGQTMLLWTVRMPPGTTSAALPPVPANVALPDVATLSMAGYFVVSNDYLDAADYDAARQLGEGGMSLLAYLALFAAPHGHEGSFAFYATPEAVDPDPVQRHRLTAGPRTLATQLLRGTTSRAR